MVFLADGRPEFAMAGFALDAEAVVVASISSGPHRGGKGGGAWDIGDRVMYKGERAQINALDGTTATIETGGRDSGSTRSVENTDSLKPFVWRTFDAGTPVELRWDKWADWHPGATVVDSFEHLHLVQWTEPHGEFTAGGAEKWVPNSMVRLPGEGAGEGVAITVSGAGCEACNGTYREDGAYKGRPLYTNKATGLQIWWNSQWRLGKTNDYYYQLPGDETCVLGSAARVWKVADFHPNEATCDPAPTFSASGLVLSGAGCEAVNGTYLEDGAYKGRPLYTNKGTGLQIWWNSQWRVGKTNDYYYDIEGEEAGVCGSGEHPWKVSTFHPNAATCAPAPTVTVFSETCPAAP
eukprot:g4638.t1